MEKLRRITWEVIDMDMTDIRCGITGGQWTPFLATGLFSKPEQRLALFNLTLAQAFVSAKVRVGDMLCFKIGRRRIPIQVQYLDARPKLLGGPNAMLASRNADLLWSYLSNWGLRPETIADPRVLSGGMKGSDSAMQLQDLIYCLMRNA